MKNIFFFILILIFSLPVYSQNNLEGFATKFANSIVKIKYNYKSHFVFTPSYYESSGFSIGDGSLIVTVLGNKNNAEAISIFNISDSTYIPAWVVARDTAQNLCILKTDKPVFKPIEFSNVQLKQAQDIVLIGWLSDYLKTNNYVITEGIVSSSAKDTLVQTSAPLNYGMEGGPALDLEGNLIGMVVSKSNSIDYEKTGFLLRKDFILNLVDSLESKTYKLDTNNTEYQNHNDKLAYEKFALASTHLYKEVEPENYSELAKGLDKYIELLEESDNYEENAHTYASFAYAYLLKIYDNSIEDFGVNTKEYTQKYNKYLNKAYKIGDSTMKKYLKSAIKTSDFFFKEDEYDDSEFNYESFESSYFRKSWNYFVSNYDKRKERKKDFNNWIRYGVTPIELDNTLEVFKNKRGDVNVYQRMRMQTIGNFIFGGPLSILNMTEVASDPYQNYKKLVPISNYFLLGYTKSGYGVRVGFQNYQRRIPLQYLDIDKINTNKELQSAYEDEQSLILGVVLYEYFEILYFLSTQEIYYGNSIIFNFTYNRPSAIDGLTDYYFTASYSLLSGFNPIEYDEYGYYSTGVNVNSLGIGLGVNIYQNFYIKTVVSKVVQSELYKLGIGLEAYY
jgi:hypothetical protein